MRVRPNDLALAVRTPRPDLTHEYGRRFRRREPNAHVIGTVIGIDAGTDYARACDRVSDSRSLRDGKPVFIQNKPKFGLAVPRLQALRRWT